MSSAYELCLDLARRRYPAAEWDWIVLAASDGDNDSSDNARVIALVGEAATRAALVAYLQIDRHQRFHWGGEQLFGVLSKLVPAEPRDHPRAHGRGDLAGPEDGLQAR